MPNDNSSQPPKTRTRGQVRRLRQLRVVLLGLVLTSLVAALIGRLAMVTLVAGKDYELRTRTQARRIVVKNPVRGQIFSQDGKLLAGNRCHYDLTMHPSLMRDPRGYTWTST